MCFPALQSVDGERRDSGGIAVMRWRGGAGPGEDGGAGVRGDRAPSGSHVSLLRAR